MLLYFWFKCSCLSCNSCLDFYRNIEKAPKWVKQLLKSGPLAEESKLKCTPLTVATFRGHK